MPDIFFGGLDFGTSGARISIINRHKELTYSNSVHYQYRFENPNSWIDSCSKLLDSLPIEVKSYLDKLAISCLLYTSPSPRDRTRSRMPSSA